MQERSSQYRAMMQADLRDTTTAAIYIGAVNEYAQEGSTVSGTFWKYADLAAPLDEDSSVTARYFTWEEKANRIDGSRYFVPEDGDETYNQGIVTEEICTDTAHPSVTFTFATAQLDIKGLAITFGQSYPLTFTIETNNGLWEYAAESENFSTENVFDGTDYIRIIPGTMSDGSTRFHIESIMFGIGILLDGSTIKSLTIKEKTHPISLELPTVDVKFTVENYDRYFNANADDSVINYLRRGQKVKAYFYQTLADGSQERIKGAYAALDSTWKDKTTTAEFSATDRLYQMDGTYEDGLYRSGGISAHDLLVDVMTQAGLESTEYYIDPYLKDITLHNPLPKDTYANCILLVANACRCIMRQDRNFRILIRASFVPELTTSSNGETDYSDAGRLLEGTDVTEYFDWEQSFNRIDGALYFPPEGDGTYSYAGYISSAMSDADGYFGENPVITLAASAAFSFYQLTVQFGNVYPRELVIRCYSNGTETESFTSEVSQQKHIINHEFTEVDTVTVEFTRAEPYSRIHVAALSVGDTTDFTIERNDMFSEPTTERQDTLKDINVIRTVYSLPDAEEDIFTDTVTLSADITEIKTEFNDASLPLSVVTVIPAADEESEDETVDYGAEIVKYSNWYSVIRFNSPPDGATEVNLTVRGYLYKVSNPVYTLNVNTTGTTPDSLENPLIDTADMAATYAEWCAEYYGAKAEYTVSKVMGDPVLESNDLAYLECEDGSEQLIRVHTVNIKFDGSYNGSSYEGRSV